MAGFHWLARALHRAGWDVLFFTGAISWLSWLRRDYRFAYPVRAEANRLKIVEPRLSSFVWFTPWHPANLRSTLLNRLSYSKFATYGDFPLGEAEPRVRDCQLVIFESTPSLLLFDRFKRLAPHARFVYRISDDLHVLKNHPVVLDTEARVAPKFDLLSAPSEYIFQRFKHLPNARLHRHGIAKELFDDPLRASPYNGRWERNVVFVGTARFDHEAVATAARQFPNWGFHLIGPLDDVPARENVIAYGEIPFAQTVAYLKHADVGFYPMPQLNGAEVFRDSLKMIQYTYCRLPIVAPNFLSSPRPHVIAYDRRNESSIRAALASAVQFDRASIDANDIRSWDELADVLVRGGE
jgi:2-beta-glucuronyltransferase